MYFFELWNSIKGHSKRKKHTKEKYKPISPMLLENVENLESIDISLLIKFYHQSHTEIELQR